MSNGAAPLGPGQGLVLRIQGTDYGGWTSVRVRRSVEEASGTWACEVSERWPGRDQPWPIAPQDACTVYLDGQLVMTGWVEGYAPSFDARSHRIEVRGRSLTADAVDSSVEIDGGQLKGLTLQQVSERVLKPLGINVDFKNAPDGGKLPDIQVQQGETAHALIERVCRMQGLLVFDDERGHLIIARPGAGGSQGTLVQGENGNIVSASAELDWSERPSDVTVKATKVPADDPADWPDGAGTNGGATGRAAGDDTGDGDGEATDPDTGEPGSNDTAVAPSGRANDPAVKRHRPLIIYGENVSDSKEAALRATYEIRRRIGKSQRARVTVQNWTIPGSGALWQAGRMVAVQAKWLGALDQSLMVAAVDFLKDESGTRTELELTLPEAFMMSAEDADQAAKPASGDDKDTKKDFWDSAMRSGPGE
jgi:prophage tail gpP-like protein